MTKKINATEDAVRAVNKAIDRRRRAIFTKNDLQEIVIENLPDVGANQRTLIKVNF